MAPVFVPCTIFSYSIEHLQKKDKVRFYYALKGRDGRAGIVKEYSVEQLGRAVLLVPEKYSAQVNEFLKYWNCKFKSRRAMVGK